MDDTELEYSSLRVDGTIPKFGGSYGCLRHVGVPVPSTLETTVDLDLTINHESVAVEGLLKLHCSSSAEGTFANLESG